MAVEQGGEQRLASSQAFVRTYNPRSHDDPWDLVEEYRRVVRYAAEHPSLSGGALSRRLNVPRSRIRGWILDDDPSRPDCVRGLHVAQRMRWVDVSSETDTFRGLNVLVASIFSGGSIDTHAFKPTFTVGKCQDLDRIAWALEWVGVDYELVRESESNRATEVLPAEHRGILGRVLVVLGAPQGKKVDQRLRLPDYLSMVGNNHRRAFAVTYLENRGQTYAGKETVTFREVRDERYLDELAGFLSDVAGEPVRRNGRNIVVSAPAARALGVHRDESPLEGH